MTKQDKELLITDLCARLPYGVKVGDIRGIRTLKEFNSNTLAALDKYKFKPILFPMSAIYETIEVGSERVCVMDIIEDNFQHSGFYIEKDGDIDIERTGASYVFLEEYRFIIDTFNLYHIDYRNLIGKGLAISVFDLSENPYKSSIQKDIW